MFIIKGYYTKNKCLQSFDSLLFLKFAFLKVWKISLEKNLVRLKVSNQNNGTQNELYRRCFPGYCS